MNVEVHVLYHLYQLIQGLPSLYAAYQNLVVIYGPLEENIK